MHNAAMPRTLAVDAVGGKLQVCRLVLTSDRCFDRSCVLLVAVAQ